MIWNIHIDRRRSRTQEGDTQCHTMSDLSVCKAARAYAIPTAPGDRGPALSRLMIATLARGDNYLHVHTFVNLTHVRKVGPFQLPCQRCVRASTPSMTKLTSSLPSSYRCITQLEHPRLQRHQQA